MFNSVLISEILINGTLQVNVLVKQPYKVNFPDVVLVNGWLMVMLINSQVISHFLFSSA